MLTLLNGEIPMTHAEAIKELSSATRNSFCIKTEMWRFRPEDAPQLTYTVSWFDNASECYSCSRPSLAEVVAAAVKQIGTPAATTPAPPTSNLDQLDDSLKTLRAVT